MEATRPLHALYENAMMQTERENGAFLVKTPALLLLLSVTASNVVSAGELAGEGPGPIEH